MTRVAVVASIFLSFATLSGMAVADDQPQVSKALAKPLKAAQEALQAKNYPETLARLREADALTPHSSYDDYVIHSLQMAAYGAQSDYPNTATAIEQIVDSSFLPAANRTQLLKTLMVIDYQQKNYDKAIQYGERARSAGDASEDTALTLAQAYYLQGKYKEALAGMDAIVTADEQAGRKPSEKGLNFIWNCAIKVKDDATAAKAVEKLILNYPKPDYWANAMAATLQNRGTDDRILLMTFRLMAEVGILKRGNDFTEMAQIALDQGNPGEAQSVLEQAFAKNLYTDARDKERNQRLLEQVKKRAQDDRASIAQDEKAAAAASAGDPYVQIGAAYLGFGQPDKALVAINAGIAKGNLKYPDEAYMLQGIAYKRTRNGAEAVKAFGKATNDPKYARLAKLWALNART
jgi:hypothetical protein